MVKTAGGGGGKAKLKSAPKATTKPGPASIRSRPRSTAAKTPARITPRGGGLDLPKFASEVSTNFARGVSRATQSRSGPGAGIGTGGLQAPAIKRASGKGGAANNAYLRKALGRK